MFYIKVCCMASCRLLVTGLGCLLAFIFISSHQCCSCFELGYISFVVFGVGNGYTFHGSCIVFTEQERGKAAKLNAVDPKQVVVGKNKFSRKFFEIVIGVIECVMQGIRNALIKVFNNNLGNIVLRPAVI